MTFKELAIEFDEFKKSVDLLSTQLSNSIKAQVAEWYSFYDDYSNIGDNGKVNKIPQIIKSIEISYTLHLCSSVNFVTLELDSKIGRYSVNVFIHTDKCTSSDGRVMRIAWEFLKNKIDLSLFPNLNQPLFSDTHEIHGGIRKYVELEIEENIDVHQMD